MLYQRLIEIDERLKTVLRLVRSGRYSTPKLADRLGVSIPTISRYVTALRERGYDIRAEKGSKEWRYVLVGKSDARRQPYAADTPFVLHRTARFEAKP
jgi:predicted DNA-binding transcriptional regulator YafY